MKTLIQLINNDDLGKASRSLLVAVLILFLSTSCNHFVEIDLPVSDLTRDAVFEDDETAERTVLGIYNTMASGVGFASGELRSISYIASLSADDLSNFSTVFPQLNQFNSNNILPENAEVTSLWTELYQAIYRTNAIIEGVAASTGISQPVRKRLEGEAKFIRAFCYFYLTNLWGNVPLVLTTDYRVNSTIPKSEQGSVYQQIITDLKDAQTLLAGFSGERLRPDSNVATALLSRVDLFVGDWANAEVSASEVINSEQYALEPDLNNVFLTTSSEAIWQLARNNVNGPEGRLLIQTNCGLIPSLVNDFEEEDQRQSDWISFAAVGENTVYFPRKYKAIVNTPVTEYSMVMRLAEQFLIRAEARALQNKLSEAQADINVIRHRAGLGNTPASTKEELLTAIEHERRVELFTEWGHRFLDLKRTNRVDAVLGALKPGWTPTAKLYPIPEIQLLNNKTNSQNEGY